MVNESQKQVVQKIDEKRDTIIAFLQKLISFPSVTGNERDIQDFISDTLRDMGLEIDIWDLDHETLRKHPAYIPTEASYENRPNVVGCLKGAGGGKSLLFNGHVDVIPPGPEMSWHAPPWSGQIEGGRMYGRGSSDMKSGLAAMTMAIQTLIEVGIKLKGDVILEYTVDEEQTGNGTLGSVMRGYKADAGICCETSSMHVQPACIGRIWFEIIVRGKPAGIQRRWEGVNAIEKGYKIVKTITNLEKIRINKVHHPLYPDNETALPCMVGVMEAGTFPSGFPDTCVLKGSIATLPGEKTNEVKKAFEEHIKKYCDTDPWLRTHQPEVIFTGYCGDPAEISHAHPIVKTLSKSFEKIEGRPPEITGRMGAADIRYLITHGATPTVIFGPGLTEQMHSNSEWVDVEDVISAVKILALATMDWCGVIAE